MPKIRIAREDSRKAYILYEHDAAGASLRDIPQEKLDELLALQKRWREAQLYLSKIYWSRYEPKPKRARTNS